MSDSSEDARDIEFALNDLLLMEIINSSSFNSEIVFSPSFSNIVTNIMSDSKDTVEVDIRKYLYFSILIYMNEHLKFPRAFTIALGNDLENNFNGTECGKLMLRYINVLANIYFQRTRNKKH